MTGREIDVLVGAAFPRALARPIDGAGSKARHEVDVGLLQAAGMPIWDVACDQGCALNTRTRPSLTSA
jgi:hypothetical protein